MRIARNIQAPLLTVTMAMIVLQFTLAASGAFGVASYQAHKVNGSILELVILVDLIVALVARQMRVPIAICFVLTVAQHGLGANGFEHHVAGVLHGLNAAIIASILGTATGLAWRLQPEGSDLELRDVADS